MLLKFPSFVLYASPLSVQALPSSSRLFWFCCPGLQQTWHSTFVHLQRDSNTCCLASVGAFAAKIVMSVSLPLSTWKKKLRTVQWILTKFDTVEFRENLVTHWIPRLILRTSEPYPTEHYQNEYWLQQKLCRKLKPTFCSWKGALCTALFHSQIGSPEAMAERTRHFVALWLYSLSCAFCCLGECIVAYLHKFNSIIGRGFVKTIMNIHFIK
jgi:hypothetical protein